MRVVEVYRLSRRLRELADGSLPERENRRLTPGQLEVLAFLSQRPRETLSGTASAMLMSKSLVSRHVRELHVLGMVTVEPDPADGRFKTVELTDLARAQLEAQAEVSVQRALYGHDPWLSYEQQRDVLNLLRSLADLLN